MSDKIGTEISSCTQEANNLDIRPERDADIEYKRKRTSAINKKGDAFSMPQDLSICSEKKSQVQAICMPEYTDVNTSAGNYSQRACGGVDIGKYITDEISKPATRSTDDAHISGLASADINKQFKQFLSLYQLQLQTQQQQRQRSLFINDNPTVSPIGNNIMPYLSFLMTAFTNAQLQQLHHASVDNSRQQYHRVALTNADAYVNTVSEDRPDIRTDMSMSTQFEGCTPATVAAITAIAVAVTQQNLVNKMTDVDHIQYPKKTAAAKKSENIEQELVGLPTTGDLLSTVWRYSDERSMPIGYLKFRFSEDCGFEQCGYRQRQSHFHCNRVDCCYSFCDKTRFLQHTVRHERLDTLMGNDFQQFRANMHCGHSNCAYRLNKKSAHTTSFNCSTTKKSSHFHCLKCTFTCIDTNKVVAHRRLHNKLENIRLAGFCKVLITESCSQRCADAREEKSRTDFTTARNVLPEGPKISGAILAAANTCAYGMKQTHYHCLLCGCGILSRTQLTTHRQKSCNTIHKTAANTSIATSAETKVRTSITVASTTTTNTIGLSS